ncbi:tRNA (adenosine(37)-N6)-threonylcarbamoyltransferase complex transferase subunit TsaD [Thalassospira profundimaris]|uniref:tRNA N6-adenosine threonylcarbamoyltransferase n=1 Tax=Thalassospira profundimaris TaxID=502049 RepID=A0A367X833_9PROT|nr:tRNA (adenosine(37)-N6)-threonylcarbamoyltransferase complex transferase subunit TsaD [Thalassospira profundimaris]RCK49280.1 protein kinase [Thalassospira profundimaris]
MIVLGIETSCDETAAAVVNDKREILANRVLSQLDDHRPYGGVVPEIAARAHLEHLDRLVAEAMDDAGVEFDDLDAVACTGGPGLIGGVMVGTMTAKAIAFAAQKPFLAVNHLEGHALTVRLTDDVAFPYLLLLVSGGHCQVLIVEGVGKYKRIGTTIDDAVGEAFDKTAKMMGLGYPGGPALEKIAAKGDPNRFGLPRPLRGRRGCDFSFSGLKTAVRTYLDGFPVEQQTEEVKADLAASFQRAVGDTLIDRARNAVFEFMRDYPAGKTMVLAGGVAANKYLRTRLTELTDQAGMTLVAPPLDLCTDNAAMIAWAGLERFRLGERDDLDFKPRPRWPLDPEAPKRPGAGVKA